MSKIQWTEKTWNPTAGCTRASTECDNCYAMTMTRRLAAMGQQDYAGLVGKGHFNGKINLRPDRLDEPLRRKKPTMWFVNSMSDLFHTNVPFGFTDKVFAAMALAPQHTFQVLTKRPQRMADYANVEYRAGAIQDACRVHFDRMMFDTSNPMQYPLPNVWLGVSGGRQDFAEQRLTYLWQTPAAIRFLSAEPLLGPLDFLSMTTDAPNSGFAMTDGFGRFDGEGPTALQWVIVGCESGNGRRPMPLDWARSIRDQCQEAGVACFIKQIEVDGEVTGDIERFPVDLQVREFPSVDHEKMKAAL